eukprot:3935953-Rhodomonas_salina.1
MMCARTCMCAHEFSTTISTRTRLTGDIRDICPLGCGRNRDRSARAEPRLGSHGGSVSVTTVGSVSTVTVLAAHQRGSLANPDSPTPLAKWDPGPGPGAL